MKNTWDWLVDMCIWHEAADPYEVYTDEYGNPKEEKRKNQDDREVQCWPDFQEFE